MDEFEDKYSKKLKNINVKENTKYKNIYEQYDIQNMAYELVKEYSKIFKADINKDFMQRMFFDIIKRQSKDQRINQFIEKSKLKIDEEEKMNAFNRLIDDANRRFEAQKRVDELRRKLDEGNNLFNKKYSKEEWEQIYHQRFKKFMEEKLFAINQAIENKKNIEKALEKQYLEQTKSKKVAQKVIDDSVNRMYADAERRKLKLQQNVLKKEFVKGKVKEDGLIDTNQRENSPSEFKPKNKKREKYQFQSDNENYSNDEKNNNSKKQSRLKYNSKNKDFNKTGHQHNLKYKSTKKIKVNNRNQTSEKNIGYLDDNNIEKLNYNFKEYISDNETKTKIGKFVEKTISKIFYKFKIILDKKSIIPNKKTKTNINNPLVNIKEMNYENQFENIYEEDEQMKIIPKPLKVNDFQAKLNSTDKIKSKEKNLHKNKLNNPINKDLATLKMIDDLFAGKINI